MRLHVIAALPLVVQGDCSTILAEAGADVQGHRREDLSGASVPEIVDAQRRACQKIPEHSLATTLVPSRSLEWFGQSQEEVGVCLPTACLDDNSEIAPDAELTVQGWISGILSYRCRDGHPSLFYFWPDPYEMRQPGTGMEVFQFWVTRLAGRFDNDVRQLVTAGAVAECPAPSCAVYASAVTSQSLLTMSAALLEDAAGMLSICYEELVADIKQLTLFGAMGMNLGLLEFARANIRDAKAKLVPRNPHSDDHRFIWRDYYSGLYQPAKYSTQFDAFWDLVLTKWAFGRESFLRFDDCALNDMIESTFGERDVLPGCGAADRAAHSLKEPSIIQRNVMLMDVEQVRRGVKALDVGCGVGRWTAMLTRLGAEVTSVDTSPYAVRSTRRYNPEKVFQMSLFDLPSNLPGYEDGFDLVVCAGVLQQTHDPLAAFRILSAAVKDGGTLFIEVYSDHSTAAYSSTHRFRESFKSLESDHKRVEFVKTMAPARVDIFDYLDGLLTFYNWAVHEETVRDWFTNNGFIDYWRVCNFRYIGRRRPIERPVRDDLGQLLASDLGHKLSEIPYQPLVFDLPGTVGNL